MFVNFIGSDMFEQVRFLNVVKETVCNYVPGTPCVYYLYTYMFEQNRLHSLAKWSFVVIVTSIHYY